MLRQNEILNKTTANLIKEITVDKEVELDIDLGTLLASDYNTFDNKAFSSNPEDFIRNLTRDNAQLLINGVWVLQTERVDEAIIAKLPTPKYILPRARRVPKPKPLTKWEQFAKKKGITKKKKGTSKLKWNEVLKKWVPGYGFKRAEADKQSNWLVELGDGHNPKQDYVDTKKDFVDPFAAKSAAKQERQSKNELQRLRNIAKAKNIKLPRVGLPSTEHFKDAKQLATAVTVARVSTASVGKFQNRLPKEKDSKEIASQLPGLKRKREAPPKNAAEEKERNVNLMNNILKSRSKILRIDTAVPTTSASESVPERRGKKKAGKQSKGGKGAKKPKAGKGKRDPHTKVGGRKRR